MAKYPIATCFPIPCFFLVVLFLIILFSLEKCVVLAARSNAKPRHFHQTHTIRLNSSLPGTTCYDFTKAKGLSRGTYLRLVHRHGPCAPHEEKRKENVPMLTQIHLNDRSRVDFLQSRHFSDLNNDINDNTHNLRDSAIPVNIYGRTNSLSDYVVTVGLGTPKQEVSLSLDTASAFTWLLCSSEGDKPYTYNPTKSRTIANVSCHSRLCSQLNSTRGISTRRYESGCEYETRFRNIAHTKGFASQETLTLTSTNVIDNFLFGCSHNYVGYELGAYGVLGLGQGDISLLKQTEREYQQVFSYCLPSTTRHTGYLWLGDVGSDSVRFVPLVRMPYSSAYGLDITGISVAGKKLEIPKKTFSKPVTIIDTGTTFTWLPPAAYDALKDEFQKWMENYTKIDPVGVFDTCYNLINYQIITFPKISFYFNEVEVEIHTSGIMYEESASKHCLAFIRNSNESHVTVFGDAQQRTLQIVHDIGRARIGFAPEGCL